MLTENIKRKLEGIYRQDSIPSPEAILANIASELAHSECQLKEKTLWNKILSLNN